MAPPLMTLADGIRFMRWAAERFDEVDPARCLTHPNEGAPALRELLESAVPLLMVEAPDAGVTGLAPTVLVDLANRDDLVDLMRVAALESRGHATQRFLWHHVRHGLASFVVLDMEFRPRALLCIAFPHALPEVRQLLEAVTTVGWLTIADSDGAFVLLKADVGVGLAEAMA
jgi:hypothetical protein